MILSGPIKSKTITDFITQTFVSAMLAYDPNLERGTDFEVEYNLDTRCYVVRYTGIIILRSDFFQALRTTLKNIGINVHFVFMKVS